MNDSAGQQQREQGAMADFDFGDYITNTANDTQHQSELEMFGEFQQRNHPPMNLDPNMVTQSLLESQNRMDHLPQSQPQSMITAEMLNLKGRLEQQMKLQHLQQLILQQQIELISGQPPINDQQKEAIFGLLTPGPSAELPAMVPKDLVPPMMLQSDMFMNNSPSATSIVNQLSPHPHSINPSFSAPAALAFPTSPPFRLPNPAQPGYDLSPLTSPWILPGSTGQHQEQGPHSLSHGQQRPQLKRTVSSSGDDQGGMRKRASPSVSSSIPQSRRNGSTTSSATSTPAMRGLAPGSGQMQFFTPSNDTPSPVDLSMPPPAPPGVNADTNAQTTTSSASSSTTLSGSASNSVSPDIAPMTPAGVLGLRKLSTGLIPSTLSLMNTEKKDASMGAAARKSSKGKGVVRPGLTGTNGATTRARRGSVAKPGFSPSLKPLLPGAIPPTPTSPLAQPTNSTQSPSSNFTLNASTGGIQGPRKTSHKAAEQKRRDSLKTSFDELRLLLPPVPLLPEEAGDEPPLPGSMPPRGPPKGDADGPNRGVSKLALLRCGNNYIRELKDKVDRRDKEIDILRDEVRRLRGRIGEEDADAAGGLDLERDVDEGAIGACASGNMCGVEESGIDGDEEGE